MKNRNFVNLNVNPCKMCMPLGAVTAFKGMENSMVILHGSQGCSTYIRRHMAGHYNEPIDIASSSLSEEGTVYGGEKNLKKGLKNIIKLYNPDIIGVATTCLAETIGEDIKRITQEFVAEEGINGLDIITVASPGYGGTQYEGFYAALNSTVKKLAKDKTPNNSLNVICANLSPGDVRNIKSMLDAFGLKYVLLPDISETLDAPYKAEYDKTPVGGTKAADIKRMAGAFATLELGVTVSEKLSPGKYLEDEFGVPLYRCPVPMGLRDTDQFMRTLSELSGKEIPAVYNTQRGRLIDAMIDSHKHNGEGRAVLYGEPELVYAISRLCTENGIQPVLISTGTESELLKAELSEEKTIIIDDTDFETIQKYAVKLKANILIGNGDGKIIEEKEGIPLVRIGFPIHDRVGGQRLNYVGYEGSMKLMDDITNKLLENKYEDYRQRMYDKYFDGKEKSIMETKTEEVRKVKAEEVKRQLCDPSRTESHPCYSSGASKNARMHIPVAPACNIACNYCNRKYDCQNESRPGVTSEVLTPEQAAEKFLLVKEKIKNLKVVGIAGPGDALANWENTRKSIQLIKAADPDITFCLSTNGLLLPKYADEILALGVAHITVTINAIDPGIAAKIYREVNYEGKKLTGVEAGRTMVENQLKGLEYIASRGGVVKVNIVMVKGVNDTHIEEVVRKVKELGAFMTNIMPLIPASGSVFENMPITNNKELNDLRKKYDIHLKQMYHCKQCRADAIGMLSDDRSMEFTGCTGSCSGKEEAPGAEEAPAKAYTLAVASRTGMLVDEHFGHVEEFYIYRYKDGRARYVERRSVKKYCTGEECEGESKITGIIKTIRDCDAVVVMRIGYSPTRELEKEGIAVIQTYGRIEESVVQAVKQLEGLKENVAINT